MTGGAGCPTSCGADAAGDGGRMKTFLPPDGGRGGEGWGDKVQEARRVRLASGVCRPRGCGGGDGEPIDLAVTAPARALLPHQCRGEATRREGEGPFSLPMWRVACHEVLDAGLATDRPPACRTEGGGEARHGCPGRRQWRLGVDRPPSPSVSLSVCVSVVQERGGDGGERHQHDAETGKRWRSVCASHCIGACRGGDPVGRPACRPQRT